MVGGCAVSVDGPTPFGECVPEPGCVTAVGLNPTQVTWVTESSVRVLVEQCVEMGWVIGEVGLHYCRGTGWGHQRWGFGGSLPAGDPTHSSCSSSPGCAF